MPKKTTAAKAGILTNSDFVVKANEPKLLTAGESVQEQTKETSGFYSIEEVPIPKRAGKKGTLTYPIADLPVGSNKSFLVPAIGDAVKKVTASIRTFASRNDFKVILRGEASGVRVWRKA